MESSGCPVKFNYLVGDGFVKIASGLHGNYGAEAIAAIADVPADCDDGSQVALIRFDGTAYDRVPRVLALDNFPAIDDGYTTRIWVSRVGGNLLVSGASIGNLFGQLFNDAETGLSFALTGGCQRAFTINDTDLRTAPRPSLHVPANSSGWIKFWTVAPVGYICICDHCEARTGRRTECVRWRQEPSQTKACRVRLLHCPGVPTNVLSGGDQMSFHMSHAMSIRRMIMVTSRYCSRLVLTLFALTVLAATAMAADPGLPYPPESEISDQKAGSILIYNLYTSSSTLPAQNSRISATNTSGTSAAFVHMFMIDGATCSVADSFTCLTAQQTTTFLASEMDPGITGFIIMISVDGILGCPNNFNFLVGSAFVKFANGLHGNIGAEAVSALVDLPSQCDDSSQIASIFFDGVSYNQLPLNLAADNFPSPNDGYVSRLWVNRIGGSLLGQTSLHRKHFWPSVQRCRKCSEFR